MGVSGVGVSGTGVSAGAASAGAASADAGSGSGAFFVIVASTGADSVGVCAGAELAGSGAITGSAADEAGVDGPVAVGESATDVVSLNDSKIFMIGLSAVFTMMRR